jgi:hypothetical protein
MAWMLPRLWIRPVNIVNEKLFVVLDSSFSPEAVAGGR